MVSFVFVGLVAASSFNSIAFAKPSSRVSNPPFPNITAAFNAGIECFPFEDPDCCVDTPYCQCLNGTFFSVNPQRVNGTESLCIPPGNLTFGPDTISIPGFCC
ncbi:hypothetical protein M426DRAFT_129861 [Hypoxylon sp. CI-4A]|nr:hypothetical protein M426DRAFT_129861 [Hypoxylon sp. CI-4A]